MGFSTIHPFIRDRLLQKHPGETLIVVRDHVSVLCRWYPFRSGAGGVPDLKQGEIKCTKRRDKADTLGADCQLTPFSLYVQDIIRIHFR